MTMSRPASRWVVDPDDPRAPPAEVWERMTPEERRAVVESLPSEFEPSEAHPPEGDRHFGAKIRARDALGGFFARTGRRVYLASELPVYYDGEPMFAPDLMAVADVEIREREKWTVAEEGKGLDFALEIVVSGRRRKDLERNVELYARLGIPEYFVFDWARLALRAFRLPEGGHAYQPLVPQGGRIASSVLGLDVAVEGARLRFFHGGAPLPESEELIARLERMVDEGELRIFEAEHRAEEARLQAEEARLRAEREARLRAEEARLRAEAERRLAEALAEIERLRKDG